MLRTSALILALATVLVAGCAEGEFPAPATATPPPATHTPTATQLPAPTPVPHITLAAVGDIMLARGMEQRMLIDGFAAPFAAFAAVLSGADVTVGNLESAISSLGEPVDKQYTFRAPALAVDALLSAGFDAVAQSNNHALDYGLDAMFDTLARLRAADIAPVGAGATDEEARAPVLIDRGGIRIALLSYTNIPSPAWAATANKAGIAWLDRETMAADVAAAAELADIVAVFFHFGIEGSLAPTDSQRDHAHAAIDSGASLVIGSHPHVLQEVEEYGGGLIAYSLGNFVFDGFDDEPHANESAILIIDLTPAGVDSWELLPVTIVDGVPILSSTS